MILWILIVLTLFLSAFFSASETAFISARRYRLEAWARQGRRGARSLLDFLKHPERYLTTTLVGNNIAVVGASTLLAIVLQRHFTGMVITAISASVLLVLGEIFPKSLARERATPMALRSNAPLQFAYYSLLPFVRIVTWISQGVIRILGMESQQVERFFTRGDLEMLVQEGAETGMMAPEDSELIGRWLKRGRQSAWEIMVPRIEVEAISFDDSLEAAKRHFVSTGHSRLPVYRDDIDSIVGIVHITDVLLGIGDSVQALTRKPLFVPESLPVIALFKQMQEAAVTMAIVVDEYGGTAGIVSMEDLFEEYFGALGEGDPPEADWVRKETPRLLDVHGRSEIDMLNDRYDLGLPEGEYSTLGGLILDQLGHIPKRGEKISLPWCKLVVFSASHQRVHWVRIIRKPEAVAET